VKLLLERGASVDAVNNNKETALMLASLVGRADVIELLKTYGAK
jgi:ankyrin repeat protein